MIGSETIKRCLAQMGQVNLTPEFLAQVFVAAVQGNSACDPEMGSSSVIKEAFKTVDDLIDLADDAFGRIEKKIAVKRPSA